MEIGRLAGPSFADIVNLLKMMHDLASDGGPQADAQLKCETFRHDYNTQRPHSSIGTKTPAEFLKSIGHPSQPMAS